MHHCAIDGGLRVSSWWPQRRNQSALAAGKTRTELLLQTEKKTDFPSELFRHREGEEEWQETLHLLFFPVLYAFHLSNVSLIYAPPYLDVEKTCMFQIDHEYLGTGKPLQVYWAWIRHVVKKKKKKSQKPDILIMYSMCQNITRY